MIVCGNHKDWQVTRIVVVCSVGSVWRMQSWSMFSIFDGAFYSCDRFSHVLLQAFRECEWMNVEI